MNSAKKQETIWKPYPEYPFIQANQFGEIRTIDRTMTRKNGRKYFVRGRVLKQHPNSNGYLQVSFKVNGKEVSLYVHRIVATCFLPNPDNLPQVNHKDCNPKNNSVENLEWCTGEYNNAYKEKYGKSAAEVSGRPVFAVNLKTFEVLRFESQSEAARQLGVCVGSINSVLKGRYNQAGGFWFTEDESEITEEKIQTIKDGIPKEVLAINLKTFKVSRFQSQREAARQLGVNQGHVNHVLKGRQKQTHGLWFCYADENAEKNIRAKFGDKVVLPAIA